MKSAVVVVVVVTIVKVEDTVGAVLDQTQWLCMSMLDISHYRLEALRDTLAHGIREVDRHGLR